MTACLPFHSRKYIAAGTLSHADSRAQVSPVFDRRGPGLDRVCAVFIHDTRHMALGEYLGG